MQSTESLAIKKACEYLQTLPNGDETRRLAFVRERALHAEMAEKAEVEARGRMAGRIEGEAIGQAKGALTPLRHLLQLKFGALPDALEQRLQRADEAGLTA